MRKGLQEICRALGTRCAARRLRRGLLALAFAIVACWSFLNYRADNKVFAWTRPVVVDVVPIRAPIRIPTDSGNGARAGAHRNGKPRTPAHAERLAAVEQAFLSTDPEAHDCLGEILSWLTAEYQRYTSRADKPFRFRIAATQRPGTPTPDLSSPQDNLWRRWQARREFFDYYQACRPARSSPADLTLYIYMYDSRRRGSLPGERSLACRRSGQAVVFVSLNEAARGLHAAVVAHELCHLLGASDKYEGRSSVFPDGYAEPDKEPRFPQEKAAIMALGIPVAEGVERRIDHLRECIVVEKTAREMGWR